MKSILTEVQNGCIEAGTVQADFGKHATGTLRTRLHLKGGKVMLGCKEEEKLQNIREVKLVKGVS